MSERRKFKGEGAVTALETIAYLYMGLSAIGAVVAFSEEDVAVAVYTAVVGIVGGVFLLVAVGAARSLFMMRHSLSEIRKLLGEGAADAVPPPPPAADF